jgi:hypothetical protein
MGFGFLFIQKEVGVIREFMWGFINPEESQHLKI